MPEFDSIKYYKQALQVSIHHFYIVDEIGEVPPFLDMINTLKTAEQHDTVFIYLNTPGGNLYTAIQIISAIRQSNATVVTCIEGMVASAGTLLFLAGHKHVVNPNCTFMIHNYSHGAWGKGNEVALRVKHSEHYFNKLAHDLYGKFLTEDEINDVINGKDFWMESEEVLKRLGGENSAASVNDLMEAISTGTSAQNEAEELSEEELLDAVLAAAKELMGANAEEAPAPAAAPKPKKKATKAKPKKA
jgi:Protease subunit of ATP-dependent Clp proteases